MNHGGLWPRQRSWAGKGNPFATTGQWTYPIAVEVVGFPALGDYPRNSQAVERQCFSPRGQGSQVGRFGEMGIWGGQQSWGLHDS